MTDDNKIDLALLRQKVELLKQRVEYSDMINDRVSGQLVEAKFFSDMATKLVRNTRPIIERAILEAYAREGYKPVTAKQAARKIMARYDSIEKKTIKDIQETIAEYTRVFSFDQLAKGAV